MADHESFLGETGDHRAPASRGGRRTPDICEPVHYVDYDEDKTCRAAIVTELPAKFHGGPAPVGLCILNPGGASFHPLAENGGVSQGHGSGRYHTLSDCGRR